MTSTRQIHITTLDIASEIRGWFADDGDASAEYDLDAIYHTLSDEIERLMQARLGQDLTFTWSGGRADDETPVCWAPASLTDDEVCEAFELAFERADLESIADRHRR